MTRGGWCPIEAFIFGRCLSTLGLIVMVFPLFLLIHWSQSGILSRRHKNPALDRRRPRRSGILPHGYLRAAVPVWILRTWKNGVVPNPSGRRTTCPTEDGLDPNAWPCPEGVLKNYV